MGSFQNNSNIDTETYVNDVVSKIASEKDLDEASKKCAPGLKYEAGSCARLSVMVELAKAYNLSANSADKIRMASNFELLNPQKYKKYLVHELSNRVGDKCKTQKCWSSQEFISKMNEKAREEFVKYTHRPESPEGKFDWLSTYNINDAMAQYEKQYNDFKFFGAVPMDFAEIGLEVGKIDYSNYIKNGIKRMGVVFNLDNHDQPGSHWTAMYSDFDKGNIYYFDSVGVKPEQRVRQLMRNQAKYMESQGKKIDNIRVDYNKVQHQKGDNACGVYAINFLVKMAKGTDFDQLCSNPVNDHKMNKCRSVYFDRRNKK
jgi:hypothetical protein